MEGPLVAGAQQWTYGTLDGELVADPVVEQFGTRVLARVSHVTAHASRRGTGADFAAAPSRIPGDRIVLLRASGDTAMRLGILEAGDRLSARGTLEPLDGYDARYATRHAAARFRVETLDAFESADGIVGVANSLRNALLAPARALSPTSRALFASFLVGDTRGLPATVVDDFRAAGLSHLLVVSGANVAFVLAACGPVIRRLTRGPRFALVLAVLILFGTMTRWEPSVARAVVMAGLVTLAATLGRGVGPLRVLVMTVIVLLVVDPFLLHSVGFGLSVGASAGIALLGPAFARAIPGPRILRETLAVTAAAQLGVLPVLLAVFGSTPLVAVPANLLAVPVAEPLTIIGLAGTLLSTVVTPFAPGAGAVVLLPVELALRWILLVARLAARVPVAVDTRAVTGLAALALCAAAVRRCHRHRRTPVPAA